MISGLGNSYTMACPPVRGDNPRAIARGLSNVHVDKHGITISYHLHRYRPYSFTRFFVLKLVKVVCSIPLTGAATFK